MGLEIKVPTVGESITEVTIAQWLKKEGEYVEMDDVLCELESDKATFELNADDAGILHIKAQEGDTLSIGDLIAEIDTEAERGKDNQQPQKGKEEKSGQKPPEVEKTGEVLEMTVPSVGESITEVTIASWLKNDGEFVELDEVIAEIESDKATFELTAEARGILQVVAKQGETLDIGSLICKIEVISGEPPERQDLDHEKPVISEQASSEENYAAGHPSPAAAKILAEKGIAPEEVKGSGVNGRITKEDALQAEKKATPTPEKSKPAEEKTKPAAGERPHQRKKMSSLRKTVARRLVAVKNEMAMLTTFNEVDMQPVMDLRKKYKEKFKEKHEVNLGFMSFFVKASCMALQEWPAVNAMIDGDDLIYNEFYDISIAVSTPKGLVVPVIRHADQRSFEGIEKEIINLAGKARDGKLSIEEMQGGTFTITNGGVFGSMLSTPIINSPQAAILGMHNIVERPVVVNGEVVVRPIMYVALSYDHRLIDGRESVSFLYRIKELIEDPARLLLGV
ncbi:MAG: 2-oxoglutarate dehydrogenase complex dihydrolipoyllysine-residue succinyltransferase [Cyclobacteriaceae bacterium]